MGANKLPRVILASASPRRAELLRKMGILFEAVPSSVSEAPNEQLTAQEMAQLLAHRKARAVAERYPDMVVLGADTIVHIESEFLGKPSSFEEARGMLERLQGRWHEVVTGVCLLQLLRHRERLFAETTRVRFLPLTAERIGAYLEKIDPLDKAGAYAIQDHGDWIVEAVEGSFSNVVGLPVERIEAELARWQEC